jgi:hypothetical protein
VRVMVALILGAGVAAAGAVVLGDYPLSGAVPWLAALIIPGLSGASMALAAGAGGPALLLSLAAGAFGGGAVAWGVRIATGYGLDPVPASAWASIGLAAAWPVAGSAVWRLMAGSKPTRHRPIS